MPTGPGGRGQHPGQAGQHGPVALEGQERGQGGDDEQAVGVDRPHQVEGEGVQQQQHDGQAGLGRAQLVDRPPVEQHGDAEAAGQGQEETGHERAAHPHAEDADDEGKAGKKATGDWRLGRKNR